MNRYVQELHQALQELADAEPKPDPEQMTAWERIMHSWEEERRRKIWNLTFYGHSDGYDALSDELKARCIPPSEIAP